METFSYFGLSHGLFNHHVLNKPATSGGKVNIYRTAGVRWQSKPTILQTSIFSRNPDGSHPHVSGLTQHTKTWSMFSKFNALSQREASHKINMWTQSFLWWFHVWIHLCTSLLGHSSATKRNLVWTLPICSRDENPSFFKKMSEFIVLRSTP